MSCRCPDFFDCFVMSLFYNTRDEKATRSIDTTAILRFYINMRTQRVVENVDDLAAITAEVREAQKISAEFSQEKRMRFFAPPR